ncbi:hypothetical protein PENSTE_c001G03190 [Penicillium steckii]|uniref:Autophagy-related protein 14 n=1 Tax=Penicillium steckii TaxID=303698 RepID=A0A1V6U104_9EURO|nr:hypothetical protein PENSTE_c001G03190 [Penicillium steckii]
MESTGDVDLAPGQDVGGRKGGPFLYPWNRRLRNLVGIWVRNLDVTPPASRGRGKTIDDDDIPNSLKSPSKFLAQSDNQSLHQSRSYSDLKSSGREDGNLENQKQKKPELGPSRRRSLLPWNDPNPRSRQEKLAGIVKNRMADTFLTIHADGIEEPLYISETIKKSTNPSFQFFDLNASWPLVCRLDTIIIKLWAQTDSMTQFHLLVELKQNLRYLQFLGKSLEIFHQPLPTNCLVFHLTDGVYANLTEIPPLEKPFDGVNRRTLVEGTVLPTSSYDQMTKMVNLDLVLQDALSTTRNIETQIGETVQNNETGFTLVSKAAATKERCDSIKGLVDAQRKIVQRTLKRREDLKSSLLYRRTAMEHGRSVMDKERTHLPDAKEKLAHSDQLLKHTHEDTKGQIRRIAEDLMNVYPIEPIPEQALVFTIRGLELPNSSSNGFGDADPKIISAALGYAAHLVHLLSFYLSVVIPYPITPSSSASLVRDPVSKDLSQRTFPLYPVGGDYKFGYGVFLLNKNIEFLLNKQGVRVLDIRQTLPNLKYLIYVLTSVTQDIPARKPGGIRGLFTGRYTPNLSRRNSADSAVSGELVQPHKPSDAVSRMSELTLKGAAKNPITTAGPSLSQRMA